MYSIIIQRAIAGKAFPSTIQLKKWAAAALKNKMTDAELTIRIVSEKEITALNAQYRHKNKPTNVLSFPFDMPPEVTDEIPLIGDIILCRDVIQREAADQEKSETAHWAHMVVHGTLHLLGYDHENPHDAEIMEAEEISILKSLKFDNPYEAPHDK